MTKKAEQKQFEVVREGLAWGRFGLAAADAALPGLQTAINLAAEGEPNNGGLDPNEFLVTPWRLLSQAVTPYRFFDFTRPGVLKEAVPLFAGVTLYTNHYADVNNWKGFVQAPVWDEKNVPPGINANLVIDRTVDANLARGVEIKALRSASVTIWFEYERSHPALTGFYDRLGEEVDGELVRFIVTRITQAAEVSIVWAGEDPYAKSLAAAGGKTETGLTEPNNKGDEEMKLTASLLALVGLSATAAPTAEELETKFKEVLAGKQSEIDGLTPDAELGRQALKETRETAVARYKALKGEKIQQAFVDGVILKADLATARALLQEYDTALDEAAPLACEACGGKMTRRSSVQSGMTCDAGGKRVDDYKL